MAQRRHRTLLLTLRPVRLQYKPVAQDNGRVVAAKANRREVDVQTAWLAKFALLLGVVMIVVVAIGVWRLLNVTGSGTIALQTASPTAAALSQTATPLAVTVTPTATPTGITAVAIAFPNVHMGVGLSSPIVGTLARGDRVQVVGKSSGGAWLEIHFTQSTNGLGWVSADLMSVTPPNAAIPVATPPP